MPSEHDGVQSDGYFPTDDHVVTGPEQAAVDFLATLVEPSMWAGVINEGGAGGAGGASASASEQVQPEEPLPPKSPNGKKRGRPSRESISDAESPRKR